MSLNKEYKIIVKDILENNKFNNLSKELHHGITRYEHSMRVSKYSYKFAKYFHMKHIKEITRASLLHDYYLNAEIEEYNSFKKLFIHPNKALENASRQYNLTDIEKDIILTHMFPLTHKIPKYKESVLVSLMDKLIGTYEMINYKIPLKLSIYLIFIINFIKER